MVANNCVSAVICPVGFGLRFILVVCLVLISYCGLVWWLVWLIVLIYFNSLFKLKLLFFVVLVGCICFVWVIWFMLMLALIDLYLKLLCLLLRVCFVLVALGGRLVFGLVCACWLFVGLLCLVWVLA